MHGVGPHDTACGDIVHGVAFEIANEDWPQVLAQTCSCAWLSFLVGEETYYFKETFHITALVISKLFSVTAFNHSYIMNEGQLMC